MANMLAPNLFNAIKKNRSANVMPKKPERPRSNQSFIGLSGKNGTPMTNMVMEMSISATELL